jgi:hypothetical protein
LFLILFGLASFAQAGHLDDEIDSLVPELVAPKPSTPDWMAQSRADAQERALEQLPAGLSIHAATDKPASKWHGLIEIYAFIPLFGSGSATLPGSSSSNASAQRDVAQVGGGNAVDVDDVSGWIIPFRFHIHRGAWGVNVEFMYADLDLKGDLLGRLGIPFNLDLRFSFVDLAATWTPLYPEPGKQPWLTQLFAGARFVNLSQELSVGSAARQKESESYVAPLVGGYFGYSFTEAWSVLLRVDFGLSSDFTYNVQLGAAWRFGKTRHWTLGFGWRVMGIKHESGSGSDLQKVDLTLNGPYLAFGWVF